MGAPRAEVGWAKGVEPGAPLLGEPIVHFRKSPGKVEVVLNDLDSLFDRSASPTYPHAGPALNETVSKFLVDTVRTDRPSPKVGVILSFVGPPLPPEQEAGIRAQLSNYFANEAEVAGLEQRVNRSEGLSSLRYGVPVVLIAGLLAAFLTSLSTFNGGVDFTELAYLAVVVVIWVMLWDPIEKLLFDSYFIRLRIRALHKLARAKITFAYRTSPAAVA